MLRRRRRRVPKGGYKPQVQIFMDQVAADLATSGTVRVPAGPWLAAARASIVTLNSCGRELGTTEQDYLDRMFVARGWLRAWEEQDLVITLPGWVQPAPVSVAIQPCLIDSIPSA